MGGRSGTEGRTVEQQVLEVGGKEARHFLFSSLITAPAALTSSFLHVLRA